MAEISTILVLLILFYVTAAAAARAKLFETNGQDGICKSMAETQGYVCHEHLVTTQDGYILSMQRMPVGLSGKTADKPPVLLQHGLCVDGITWLLNSPDQSLAFILADNGYDVWVANTRGTKYSFEHTSLSPNDPAYWEWSWDELVAYDLPASVQYVHDQTGQKLHYVGHSLGTLIALGALSQEKLLNMLRSAALLTPIAHLGQLSSPLIRSGVDIFFFEDLNWLGIYEFAPRKPKLLPKFFQDKHFFEHEPQSTAMKNLLHLSRMIREGSLAMYDYGNEDDNMNHYGQPTPPIYNMTNIPSDFPLFLSYGGKDFVTDVEDVKILLDDLKYHDGDKLVVQYIEDYPHLDFIFGVNANQVVYNPLMAFFELH